MYFSRQKNWFSGQLVIDEPLFVRFMVNYDYYFRGVIYRKTAGQVYKVSSSGSTITLFNDNKKWGKYSYSLFIEATEIEYNEFNYGGCKIHENKDMYYYKQTRQKKMLSKYHRHQILSLFLAGMLPHNITAITGFSWEQVGKALYNRQQSK